MRRSAISGPFWLSVLLVLPVTLSGCMRTSTYGTGEMPEMALFREVTGGILDKNHKKQPIDYQPRAPLVMPAAAEQLPPPVESAAAASPDWPADPGERIAAPVGADDDNPLNDINQAEYRRLKPLQGVFPQQAQNREAWEGGPDEYYRTIVHGRTERAAFAKAVADSKGYGRTDRRFLTDPPIAYREPVGDASTQTAAVEPPKGNFLTRWWHRH